MNCVSCVVIFFIV